jgi:hypothetical protein
VLLQVWPTHRWDGNHKNIAMMILTKACTLLQALRRGEMLPAETEAGGLLSRGRP